MSYEIPLPWLVQGPAKPKPVPKSEWGPRGWAWLHTQAINYSAHPSKADQMAMFARFWSFIQTLPCQECRIHATNYAREYPPDFSGSAGFQTWAWRFHNAVNYRLGKPLMTAEEYRQTYAEEIAASYWKYVV
jgi:hypothetical protein